MRAAALVVGLATLSPACGLTPRWPSDARSPYGDAPWAHPTEQACDTIQDPTATVVDGFTWCHASPRGVKIAVDDPIFEPCRGDLLPDDVPLMAVFDGARADGYPIALLGNGRELLATTWGDEPLLVDW